MHMVAFEAATARSHRSPNLRSKSMAAARPTAALPPQVISQCAFIAELSSIESAWLPCRGIDAATN